MTRSHGVSQRKSFNKAVRQRATQEQASFASVLERAQTAQATRAHRSMLNLPSHLNRTLRRGTLGDDLYHIPDTAFDEEEVECGSDEERRPEATTVVDLLAFAKPAKARGVAKDFEIVGKVKNVIVLDDQDFGSEYDGDDWETVEYDIFYEGAAESKKTYSAALTGR